MARQFGIVILLLVSYLTPAMACVVSDAQMNAQERACCQTMSEQCGQTDMAAGHSCCQKVPASNGEKVLPTTTAAFHPIVTAIVYVGLFDLLTPAVNATQWVRRPDYSPPESPPASVSVLRL